MPKLASQSLTMAFCRSMRPNSSAAVGGKPIQMEYPDAEVRGLALRVSPGGQKAWTYRYRDRLTGKQSRVTLGTFDPTADGPPHQTGVRQLTLNGARLAARQLRAQVDAGLNPAQALRNRRETARLQAIKTMAHLANAYFAACEAGTHRGGNRRKKAASTLAQERWLWRKYLDQRLGADAVEAVSRAGLRAVLREVLVDAPSQSNKVPALLSQMLNFAVAEERIATNPVVHVPRMGEDKARTRTLTQAELRALWMALQDPSQLRSLDQERARPVRVTRMICIAIELCLLTLQRRGEVAGMRRQELDLETGIWIIPEHRTKARAEHLVPLSSPAVTLIEEALQLQAGRRKGQGAAIFPSPRSKDGPISPGALSHAVAEITRALRLPDATLHDLRRTGATALAAMGAPPFVISKVLAHRDSGGGAWVTARHYNLYAYAPEKREALERWASRLKDIVSE